MQVGTNKAGKGKKSVAKKVAVIDGFQAMEEVRGKNNYIPVRTSPPERRGANNFIPVRTTVKVQIEPTVIDPELAELIKQVEKEALAYHAKQQALFFTGAIGRMFGEPEWFHEVNGLHKEVVKAKKMRKIKRDVMKLDRGKREGTIKKLIDDSILDSEGIAAVKAAEEAATNDYFSRAVVVDTRGQCRPFVASEAVAEGEVIEYTIPNKSKVKTDFKVGQKLVTFTEWVEHRVTKWSKIALEKKDLIAKENADAE